MGRIADYLTIERQRGETAWNVIHLFKDGGFYRAYEYSAWLIVTVTYNDSVRQQTQDRRPLSVTHKAMRGTDDSFAFVGFPLKSVDKFIPQRAGFEAVTDTQLDITINLPEDFDAGHATEAFSAWKCELPLQQPKSTEEPHTTGGAERQPSRTLTGIMAEILAYPLEQHTPMDNTMFISRLKQDLAKLI